MAKYSEGTWWDGYEAAKKEAVAEFLEKIDEFEIFDIIEGLQIDKSGKVMEYLHKVAEENI